MIPLKIRYFPDLAYSRKGKGNVVFFLVLAGEYRAKWLNYAKLYYF